uniref:Uncharacterized protein n=1 Tax=viral metagenome TaxID=1070528 RepID=A0A2V0R9P0_9ZZZZ
MHIDGKGHYSNARWGGNLLHAMPTVGKSWLAAEHNNRDSVAILDTDWLHFMSSPDGDWTKWWRKPEDRGNQHALDVMAGWASVLTDRAMQEGLKVVTNLSNILPIVAYGKGSFPSFGRSAAAINALSIERGGAIIETAMAARWVDGWRKNAHSPNVSAMIELEEGEYLSQVLDCGTLRHVTSEESESFEICLRDWVQWGLDLQQYGDDGPVADGAIVYGATGRWFKKHASRKAKFVRHKGLSFHKEFEGTPGREGQYWEKQLEMSDRLEVMATALKQGRAKYFFTCKSRAVALELQREFPNLMVLSASMWARDVGS